MKSLIKRISYKILIIAMITVILSFFSASSVSEAKLKIGQGEFYYTGTQDAEFTWTNSFLDKIIKALSEIANYLMGIMTLGVRMVVIGWIEVMEIILTAILGSEINFSEYFANAMNGMDSYSQQIVNVEKIIFNKIEILDANIFKNTETTTSGSTGNPAEQSNGENNTEPDTTSSPGENEEVNTSESYREIVKIIKNSVAKWYIILRLIVIAFMLILLIFIGIKMAISTIASEKAAYKQMLVDWVVGMVIVFGIHYIMIAILNINDNIIDSLKDFYKDKKIEIQEEYEYGEEKSVKSASEIETTLYESARTRAYSLKLTDSFTGIIIYGVLVYYAWKFALIYIRRLINIMLLTLLAPPVSASYAFNKAITGGGKAKIFSTWLSEYIMNVIIQIVHIIIYITFVSTALQLSLISLPGTILAMILLNFMSKADKILRQLFKLSGGSGSLAGQMADKTGFKELRTEIKGLKTAMVGGKATQMAMGATYRAATKPFRAAGEVAFGKIMEHKANSEKYQSKQKKEEEELEDLYNEYTNSEEVNKKRKEFLDKENRLELEQKQLKEKQEKLLKEKEHLEKKGSQDELKKKEDEIKKNQQEIQENQNKLDENFERYEEFERNGLQQEFIQYYQTSGTAGKAIKENIAGIFDPSRYTKKGKDGKWHRIKTQREGGVNKAFWRKKTDGIGKRFLKYATIDNIFGLDEKEKKIIKNEYKYFKDAITGVITGIAGIATLGVNPLAGMALLGQSGVSKLKTATRRRHLRNRAALNSKSYKFKAFSSGAEKAITEEAVRQAKFAESQLTKRNMKRHNRWAKKLIESTTTIVRPIAVGGVTLSGVCFGLSLGPGIHGEIATKLGSTRYTGKVIDVNTFAEERLDALYQKKLRDNFKTAKKSLVAMNTVEFTKDYKRESREYRQKIKEDSKQKSKRELLVEEKLSSGNAIKIGNTIIKIETNDKINKFIDETNKIDQDENKSRKDKIHLVTTEIEKNQIDLIKNSIVKLSAERGITDINNLKLKQVDNIEIKKDILGEIEKRGIIDKGDVKPEEVITDQKIKSVYNILTADKDNTNNEIEDRLVQNVFLEYMATKGITNVEKLKEDETKQEIYDIIKDKMMSDTSRSSASVISQISGQDKMKEQFELPDTVKEKVKKMPRKVKKLKLSDIISEDTQFTESQLIERRVRRQENISKEKIEEAVYTEEEENLDESQLRMLFLLSEIKKQNLQAQKLGEKTSRKRNALNEMQYYQRKNERYRINSDGSRQYNSANDGSRTYGDTSDKSAELNQKMKNLQTVIHGKKDIIDLINNGN